MTFGSTRESPPAATGRAAVQRCLQDRCREVLEDAELAVDVVEAYAKRSRTRGLVQEFDGTRHELRSSEAGWALRYGDARRSGFAAFGGAPAALVAAGVLPAPDGRGLTLPPGSLRDNPAAERGAPARTLFGATEAAALFDALELRLREELPRAQLVRLVLEEGLAEHSLVRCTPGRESVAESSAREPAGRAFEGATWRSRAASLLIEARLGDSAVRVYQPLSSSRDVRPQAAARRVADRLDLRQRAQPFAGDRCEVMLTAELSAWLLASMPPGTLDEKVGSTEAGTAVLETPVPFDLLEDAATEGPSSTSHDGTGLPVRRRLLVDQAVPCRSPVEAWWRPSWREPPRRGFGQLKLTSRNGVPVSSLLSSLTRGVYLVDGWVEAPADGQLRVSGRGWFVRRGRAEHAVGPVSIMLPAADWLWQLRAFGRVLEWVVGAIGARAAPSLVLRRAEVLGG